VKKEEEEYVPAQYRGGKGSSSTGIIGEGR